MARPETGIETCPAGQREPQRDGGWDEDADQGDRYEHGHLLNEASLASQLGKPWVKMDLSALSSLAGSSGAGLAQLIHSLQSNNFGNQAQMLTVAKNPRLAGTQTIDGVSTTEYTGSFTAAQGLKALPADFRQAFARLRTLAL